MLCHQGLVDMNSVFLTLSTQTFVADFQLFYEIPTIFEKQYDVFLHEVCITFIETENPPTFGFE